MRLSSKTRYAVRALIDLAINYKGKPILIKDIAKRQRISVRYLENIFTVLRAGGILNSNKGLGGGFYLKKVPEHINMLDVVNLLEGGVSLVECVDSNIICNISKKCVTRNVWSNLNDVIKKNLASVTLEDLIKRQIAIN